MRNIRNHVVPRYVSFKKNDFTIDCLECVRVSSSSIPFMHYVSAYEAFTWRRHLACEHVSYVMLDAYDLPKEFPCRGACMECLRYSRWYCAQ